MADEGRDERIERSVEAIGRLRERLKEEEESRRDMGEEDAMVEGFYRRLTLFNLAMGLREMPEEACKVLINKLIGGWKDGEAARIAEFLQDSKEKQGAWLQERKEITEELGLGRLLPSVPETYDFEQLQQRYEGLLQETEISIRAMLARMIAEMKRD